MTEATEKHRLFMIHAGADRDQARRVARYIERLPGVRVSLSGNVEVSAGEDFVATLREEIAAATVVVFLLTPQALDSEWSLTELGMARGMGKPVRVLQGGSVPLRTPIRVEQNESFDPRTFSDPEAVQRFLSTVPSPS